MHKPKSFRKRTRSEDEEEDATPNAAAIPIRAPTASVPSILAPPPPTTTTLTRELSSFVSSSGAGAAQLEAIRGGAVAEAESLVSSERDLRSQLERRVALQAETLTELSAGGPRLYHGQAAYTSFRAPPKDAASVVASAKHSGLLGPSRAPANVRGICRVDYDPSLCKDWKETGQCPFGDSCIYLHDRGDYKSGWQIDRDWAAAKKEREGRIAAVLAGGGTLGEAEEAEAQREKRAAGGGGGGEVAPLPTACFICRGSFRTPILTQCGHYFCEPCAVEKHRTNAFCAVCGAETRGLFHAAPKLVAAIKEREREKGEGGGEGGGGGGGGSGSGSGSGSGGDLAAREKGAEEGGEGGGGGRNDFFFYLFCTVLFISYTVKSSVARLHIFLCLYSACSQDGTVIYTVKITPLLLSPPPTIPFHIPRPRHLTLCT